MRTHQCIWFAEKQSLLQSPVVANSWSRDFIKRVDEMFNTINILVPNNGKQEGFSIPIVQELASRSLKTLPDRYIRSEQERPSFQHKHHTNSIPIIDMANFLDDNTNPNEMKKLALACQEWGFFHIVNHGISESLMKRMKGVTRDFFHLPLEEKLKYKLQGTNGYGQAFVASDDQKLDWSDIMFLSIHPPQNRNMAVWPTNPADFRETVDQYSAEIHRLGATLLRLLAQSLGLQPEGLIKIFGRLLQSIRMNFYPPCPDPDLALGLSPHSDADAITILLQEDEKVGLQVLKEGKWNLIQPIPNAFVINIGDMIEVVSNGRYKSIEHRAVTSRDKDRLSIATFIAPPREFMVGPASELIDELHPQEYITFKYGDYLCNLLAGKLEGKKAIQFAKMKAPDSGFTNCSEI